MSLFLLSFFLVYGSMHAYALLKARSALAFGPGTTLALLLLLGAPPVRADRHAPAEPPRLRGRGEDRRARRLPLDGVSLLLRLPEPLRRPPPPAPVGDGARRDRRERGGGLAGRSAFLCIAGLAVALSAYAIVEASRIEVVRVRIVTDRLPASVPSLRIAQITDLHLGLIHRIGKAREVAALVARERPDLFVSTGDLVDGQLDGVEELAEILRGIPAPRGKFAVLGNHEYYAGIDRAIAFTRKSGFTLLRDESVTIDDAVRIAGVDDPAGARFGRTGGTSEAALLGIARTDGSRSSSSTAPNWTRPRGEIRPAALGAYPPRADLPVPPPHPAGLPAPRGGPPRPRGRDPACEPGHGNVGAPDAVPRPPGDHRRGHRALHSGGSLRSTPLSSVAFASAGSTIRRKFPGKEGISVTTDMTTVGPGGDPPRALADTIAALRKSEERLQAIVFSLPDLIFRHRSGRGRSSTSTPLLPTSLPYEPGAVPREATIRHHASRRDRPRRRALRPYIAGRPFTRRRSAPCRSTAHPGRASLRLRGPVRAMRIRRGDRRSIRDITARSGPRKRSGRTRSICGRSRRSSDRSLAGGMAHHLNNLMTVVTGYCELLLTRIPAADPLRPDIEKVRRRGNARRI